MNIKNYINEKVKKILDIQNDIAVEIPQKEDMGDYSIQCSSYRNEEMKNPVEIANFIMANFVDEREYFLKIQTAGPYLNFFINYNKLSNFVISEIEEKKATYGSSNQGNNESLLIEHTSINPNAEPHIGRCRNALIGDFMSNLFKFTGYNTERHYFINDLGQKIAFLVIGIEKYGLESDDFSSILDIYIKISEEAKKDDSLETLSFEYLKQVESGNVEMVEKFKNITDKCVKGQLSILKTLGIEFDIFTHESNYVYNNYLQSILDKLREKNKLRQDEHGRYYVDLSDYNIPTREPVLVLTRSNGTSLYPVKDIAYSIDKINKNNKNNFIVLGEDQEVYMQQISAVLDILGYKAPKLICYSYVLLDGGKMSTSGGTVVLMTEFIKEVNNILKEEFASRNIQIDNDKIAIMCNACIKFTMLNVSKNKIVNFNLKNATSFNGESGMYILYSIVRINSILNNTNFSDFDEVIYEKDIEKKLVKNLYRFPEIVDDLLKKNEPAHLTKYLFNLTQDFSKFYESVSIKHEENEVLKSSRIKLIIGVKTVLENGLSILGIKTIDKI